MGNFQVTEKELLTSVDRAADSLPIYDNDAKALKRTVVNNLLDLTSHPVGVDDTQTLTLKTLTAPTISSPILSGTITGTYALGGTPTFPAAVATLTGSQTLTNKTLTSPTINTATISNPTLTVDTVSEYTAANGVTVDGLNIKDGKLTTSNSVVTANYTDESVTPAKRSGGFYIGVISAATVLNTTGNKAITGVGFTPKLVRFTVITGAATTTSSLTGFGAMTSSAQFSQRNYTNGAVHRKLSTTAECIGWTDNATSLLRAEYVSMDADGFTINVVAASASFDVAFEAYA